MGSFSSPPERGAVKSFTGSIVGVGEAVPSSFGSSVGMAVAAVVGVWVGSQVPVGDGEGVTVMVGVNVAVAVDVPVGKGLGEGDGDGDGSGGGSVAGMVAVDVAAIHRWSSGKPPQQVPSLMFG